MGTRSEETVARGEGMEEDRVTYARIQEELRRRRKAVHTSLDRYSLEDHVQRTETKMHTGDVRSENVGSAAGKRKAWEICGRMRRCETKT